MKFVDPGQRPKIPSLCHYSLQWGNQGRGPLPLIFGPNCGRKGRKKTAPLRISGSGWPPPPPPPLSVCLDPPQLSWWNQCSTEQLTSLLIWTPGTCEQLTRWRHYKRALAIPLKYAFKVIYTDDKIFSINAGAKDPSNGLRKNMSSSFRMCAQSF